jgi:glycosidase
VNRVGKALTFAIAAAIYPEASCVSVPVDGQQPAIATHVQDWRDEVIYQLIVDRFADGDINNDYNVQKGELARYQGGDWLGIQQHLDYLLALGVTTLWISPVVRNVETDANIDAYHGYWAQDFTQTNPHFGDLPALRSMIAAAHDAGLKVVLDIVVNHVGQVFFYDMNHNGVPDVYVGGSGCDPNSPATSYGKGPDGTCLSPVTQISEFDPDWDPNGVQGYSSLGNSGRAPIVFIDDPTINRIPPQPGILGTVGAYHGMGHILDFTNDVEVRLGDFTGGLKDVATELPEVRATMVDVYSRWVELADFDGFRIDTVKHVEHEFWQTFSQAVHQRLAQEGKNRFMLFGEVFDGDDAKCGSYTVPGELDSVVDFPQYYTVFSGVFAQASNPSQQAGTNQIQTLWDDRVNVYGTQPQANGIGVAPAKSLVNFIDNHDVARFLYSSNGDVAALRNALTLLYTEEGIPDLYYGTEQEFSGGNDPSNREILWNANYATTGDTFQHIAKLARIRKAYQALTRGDTKVVWSTADVGTETDAGMFAFERAGGDAGSSYALVVMNTSDTKASSPTNGASGMTTSATPNSMLVDVLDPMQASYPVDANGQLNVTVPAQSAMILVPSGSVVQGI